MTSTRWKPAKLIRVSLLAAVGCCVLPVQSPAQSSAVNQEGAYTELLPADRDEIADTQSPGWTVSKIPLQQYMKEIYWDFPQDTPAFFRDTIFQTVGRTYYLNRENFNGSRSQAGTIGGWTVYRSGLIADIFGVQAAFYTSQPLYAPDGEGGSKLLTPNQGALNSFAQVYGRAQILDQELRAGRQLVNTPLINAQDNRMVPNTFEGITLDSLPDKDRNYDYAVGYLTTIKQRDSNKFIAMSDALAGSHITNRGAAFGMLNYRPTPELSMVFMDYGVPDFVNTGFVQAEYDFKRPKDQPNLILGANIIDQVTVGQNLLTNSSFHTHQASVKVQTVYAGLTLFAVGSVTGDESKLFSPFGTKPNYTDMQQSSFDNAGEKAIGASVAYDFGHAFGQYGLNGLSLGVWDTQGFQAFNPANGSRIADRNELDVWLQYRPTLGPLQGFRFKTQYSDVWQKGSARNHQPEFRAIIDYTILFRPPVI